MIRKPFSERLFVQALMVPLVLFVVTLIGFWPLVTGLFSVKNDDIVYFLPYRYNIVESIRNGYFPLWNPYIYMGLPVAGDMQSGVWNPFVWLLSLTGRYTLTTLHVELLIYVFLGGLGMFKLMSGLQFKKIVCYTIAISFMFCGFMLDSGQILSWICCACFLPYAYVYIVRLFQSPSVLTSIKFAGSLYLLLVAGGYPFFFIVNMYLLAVGFVVFFVSGERNLLPRKIRTLKFTLLSFVLFLAISAAPLLSFFELLPHYPRGQGVTLNNALFNAYSPLSSLSLLFPFAVTRAHDDFVSNLVISRSIYVGILLLPFIVIGILQKRTAWWNTVLVLASVCFVLSLAEILPFRKWAYWYLPFMNSFRHPANFRLFVAVALLLFAGKGLGQVLSANGSSAKKPISLIFTVLLCCMAIIAIYHFPLKEAIHFTNLSATPGGLKNLLGKISFRQGVFISFLLQLPFVIAAIVLINRRNYPWLCYLSILNVILIGQPQLFTGAVGKNPTTSINKFIHKQAAGFPLPDLASPVAMPDENKKFLYEYKEPLAFFFNKQVAINTLVNSPTILKNYNIFINDSSLISNIKNCPFIYLADSIKLVWNEENRLQRFWLRTNNAAAVMQKNKPFDVARFTPNGYLLTIKTDSALSLVILQNNLPGWKASSVKRALSIQTVNHTFMGIELPAGSYDVRIQYRPGWLIPGMIISLLGLILSGILLLMHYIKKNSNGMWYG